MQRVALKAYGVCAAVTFLELQRRSAEYAIDQHNRLQRHRWFTPDWEHQDAPHEKLALAGVVMRFPLVVLGAIAFPVTWITAAVYASRG